MSQGIKNKSSINRCQSLKSLICSLLQKALCLLNGRINHPSPDLLLGTPAPRRQHGGQPITAHSNSPSRQTKGQNCTSRKTKQHNTNPFVQLHNMTASPFGVFLGFSVKQQLTSGLSSLIRPQCVFHHHHASLANRIIGTFFLIKEKMFIFSLIHGHTKLYVGLP